MIIKKKKNKFHEMHIAHLVSLNNFTTKIIIKKIYKKLLNGFLL